MQPGFPTERERAHYALLHDFCMSIPYSGFVFLWGLKLCIFNSFVVGALHLIAGAIVAACSVYSLQLWKRGLSSLMSQLISATTAMYVAWIWGVSSAALPFDDVAPAATCKLNFWIRAALEASKCVAAVSLTVFSGHGLGWTGSLCMQG